jgi:hypothetical protein
LSNVIKFETLCDELKELPLLIRTRIVMFNAGGGVVIYDYVGDGKYSSRFVHEVTFKEKVND